MEINKELIKKVAKNARLELKDSEVEKFTKDFKDILNTFSELDSLDVKDTKPSFHPVQLEAQFRDDEAKESLSQEEALSNVEHKKDGFIKGPKAI